MNLFRLLGDLSHVISILSAKPAQLEPYARRRAR